MEKPCYRPARPKKPTSFLDLPPEIRQQIYVEIFSERRKIYIHSIEYVHSSLVPSLDAEGIFQINVAVRQEALDYLYESREFILTVEDHLVPQSVTSSTLQKVKRSLTSLAKVLQSTRRLHIIVFEWREAGCKLMLSCVGLALRQRTVPLTELWIECCGRPLRPLSSDEDWVPSRFPDAGSLECAALLTAGVKCKKFTVVGASFRETRLLIDSLPAPQHELENRGKILDEPYNQARDVRLIDQITDHFYTDVVPEIK